MILTDYYSFFMAYLYGPLWFVWDIVGTVGILVLVRKWIKANVTDTSDDVLEKIIEPQMAEKVRVAWDIPNRSELKAAITGIAIPPFPSIDLEPIKAQIAAISLKIEGIEAKGLQVDIDEEDLQKRIAKAANSALGTVVREENKAKETFINEYKESTYAAADQKFIYDRLVEFGVPPGMAEFAALNGPTAARWAAEEFLGVKKAAELSKAWEKGRMIQLENKPWSSR